MSNERDGFMVDRSIWSHEMFEDEPFTQREAWLWIIGQAAWAERKVRGPLGPITLQRGQLSHSVRFIADVWQWSKSRVDRFIDKLEKRDMVRRVSGTGQLTLSICNYEHYQLTPGFKRDTIGTASGTRAGHERDTSGTNKNQEIKKSLTPPTPSPSHEVSSAAPTAAEEEISIEDIDRMMGVEPAKPVVRSAKDIPLDKLYELMARKPLPKAKATTTSTRPADDEIERDFAELWAAYPSRGDAGNPRKPALASYRKARAAGADHAAILAGVRELAAKWRKEPKDRWQYVPQAATWLNQERWNDAAPAPAKPEDVVTDDITEDTWDIAVYAFNSSGQWATAAMGPSPKEPGCRAPAHILARYGYKAAA